MTGRVLEKIMDFGRKKKCLGASAICAHRDGWDHMTGGGTEKSTNHGFRELNFEAKDYTDIIIWEGTDVSITVPPVLRNVLNEELIDKLSLPDNTVPEWSFTAFPFHTLAVEQTVKLVTEAAFRVCGCDSMVL
ncbi:hypothetical protein AVEN_265108-1 [Araneus ventricosus]|uniref:Uncharacterized protein n=1 Tax=Araneus ventricosus TaxID=182803 RepID=A0A4Y2TJA2_ARAVE|nr:hypothetical protein AVEN_265108-1 [Araneus ventricosus]